MHKEEVTDGQVSTTTVFLAIVVIFLLMAWSSCTTQPKQLLTPSGRPPAQYCTVCVYVQREDSIVAKDSADSGTVGLGVGVLVNNKGDIVTAKHLLRHAKTIHVKQVCDPGTDGLDSASFIDSSYTHDIAVIRLKDPGRLSTRNCWPVTFAEDTTAVLHGMDLDIQGWDCDWETNGNRWMWAKLSDPFGNDSMTISGPPTWRCSGAGVFLPGTNILIGCLSGGKGVFLEDEGELKCIKGFVMQPLVAVHFRQIKDLLDSNHIYYNGDTLRIR